MGVMASKLFTCQSWDQKSLFLAFSPAASGLEGSGADQSAPLSTSFSFSLGLNAILTCHNWHHLAWAIANNFWVNAAENDQSKARYGKKEVKVINSRLTLSSHWGDWLLHTPKFWKNKKNPTNRKQTNPLPQAHLYHFKTAFSGILIVSMFIHQVNNPMSVLYLV